MKIKVFNYMDDYEEHEIPDETTHLNVRVLTGDEVVTVYIGDERWDTIDGDTNGRWQDFLDDDYDVKRCEFEAWNTRTGSYDHEWWGLLED